LVVRDGGAGGVAELVREEAPLLAEADVAAAVATVVAAVEGLGPLEPLVRDPSVSDVLVNGDGAVWIERAGRLERTAIVLRSDEVLHLIERIVAPLGLRADRSSPCVDARLPDGSRVHAVVPPLAVDGPCLAIRRFGATAVPLAAFAPAPVVELLRGAVASGANVVVAGGTGAGKTTLLNALAAEIPPGQRIITVEDAAELRLPQDHVVRLESRPANAEGAGAASVRELVRNALRMRPDRLIVGECRGAEALDMLQAMNTGHDGSMTTCHANGCVDALRRLETMVLLADVGLPLVAVREQLASAVDLVVQVVRGAGGVRRVVAVGEVVAVGRDAGDAAVAPRVRPLVVDGDVVDVSIRPARSVVS
jgi:pilus assembly protein CpaF